MISRMAGQEIDEKIRAVLAHGRKRPNEVKDLLDNTVRQSRKTIGKRLRSLAEHHGEPVEKKEYGQATYYYRIDTEETIIRPKPLAPRAEVDDCFQEFKRRLRVETDTGLFSTEPPSPLPKVAADFEDLARGYKSVLYSDEAFEEFNTVFESILERLEETYDTGQSGTTAPTTPLEVYTRFFNGVIELYDNWDKGRSHDGLYKYLHTTVSDIDEIIRQVPPELGQVIQTLALHLNRDLGRTFFEEMVKNSRYTTRQLRRRAFYSYDVHNDLDKLIGTLADLRAETDSRDRRDRIRELENEIRKAYTSLPKDSKGHNMSDKET
jgi:hypothetical protein